MRTPEEAAKALNLNGIPYLGNVLKLVSCTRFPKVEQRSIGREVTGRKALCQSS